jgi:hypothetical protein
MSRIVGVGMPTKRFLLVLLAAASSALIFSGVAWALYTYAGPKTWLPGYYADSSYDQSPWWHWYNEMNKSCQCLGRVTFIKPDGSWVCSNSDVGDSTFCYYTSGYQFVKKAYCKNNSDVQYTGDCQAGKQQ